MPDVTPNEALAQTLHGAECGCGMDWYTEMPEAEPIRESYRRAAKNLTTAGYALVPVKEALTVERIAEALKVALPFGIWLTQDPNEIAAAFLAALETPEVTK